MTTWQPIATCPKETDVLLYSEMWAETFGEIQIVQIDHGGEWNFQSEMQLEPDDKEAEPAHWMPLPEPPEKGR